LRVRSVWHLSVVHAVLLVVGSVVAAVCVWTIRVWPVGRHCALQFAISAGNILFWYYFGKRVFERFMLSGRS